MQHNQNDRNPDINNQYHLPPEILNLDSMAYIPIAKLEKFTSEENDAQIWLNNIEKAITANRWNDTRAFQVIFYFLQNTTNSWYQSLAAKPQTFQEFKVAFLGYFSNNNSIYQPQPQNSQNPNVQHYLSFLITPKDASPNNSETNQKQSPTNNITPVTVTNNKLLTAIFLFELKETTLVPLFSGAAFDTKPITTMYTNAKVDGHAIKLILDSGLAGSIITRQLMNQLGHRVNHAASARIITADEVTKTPIGEIDNFPFEVNGIIILIKVLVIEATQY
ncbi:hypothetical protein G9A89_010336 [Geosiphon pyriformis]|nr:hypothetical protein G9A89_010336 [Geosiphon pyriformis]